MVFLFDAFTMQFENEKLVNLVLDETARTCVYVCFSGFLYFWPELALSALKRLVYSQS